MVTHKVETHNSPSALDPFGGAITGIVGVNRDTIGFGLGAKPVANTYGFCFGYPDDTRPLFRDKAQLQKMLPPKRIIDGVIKGVNVGGNCSGIPTVSGFVRYDERFRAKPLVFVGTVGLMPRKINGKLSHIKKCQERGLYSRHRRESRSRWHTRCDILIGGDGFIKPCDGSADRRPDNSEKNFLTQL